MLSTLPEISPTDRSILHLRAATQQRRDLLAVVCGVDNHLRAVGAFGGLVGKGSGGWPARASAALYHQLDRRRGVVDVALANELLRVRVQSASWWWGGGEESENSL